MMLPVVQDGPPRLVGYARVSTDDQTTALQADALARAAVDVVFQEEASGASSARYSGRDNCGALGWRYAPWCRSSTGW